MLPLKHFVIGLIISSLLLIIFPSIGLIPIFLVLASNSLIDSDHYLFYVCHKRNLNPRKAYNWFIEYGKKMDKIPEEKQKQFKMILLIFHGIEFWTILILLSFVFSPIKWVLLGIAIHISCDMVGKERAARLFKNIVTTKTYIKNKKKKKIK